MIKPGDKVRNIKYPHLVRTVLQIATDGALLLMLKDGPYWWPAEDWEPLP